ncbi:MAG: 50S ribosomal protein L25/general stress protein Ctc [Symploca sp. SIO2C1]|nr:50S ribosomal protein L25/general stress protein Ctc [Symploca sp. SIO2C1]
MEVTVECQKRPEDSKPRALRRSGIIPAVLYGHTGTESVSLTIEAKVAETLLKEANVNNTLVQLKVPDLPWEGKALLREVQTHPWKNELYHLSFFSVASQDTIDVVVPLQFLGEAVGVKQGGILETELTELAMQCAPSQIPESIDIDVSGMEIGSSLHIHELVLPEGVALLDDPDRTVVKIITPSVGAAETVEESEEATAEQV